MNSIQIKCVLWVFFFPFQFFDIKNLEIFSNELEKLVEITLEKTKN
jgi:hypothetical protein